MLDAISMECGYLNSLKIIFSFLFIPVIPAGADRSEAVCVPAHMHAKCKLEHAKCTLEYPLSAPAGVSADIMRAPWAVFPGACVTHACANV